MTTKRTRNIIARGSATNSSVRGAACRARGCFARIAWSRSAARKASPPAGRAGFRPAENHSPRARSGGSRGRRAARPIRSRSPVGAALRHGGGDGVVRARLVAVAGGPRAREQLIDQHARAGAGIAVDHEAQPGSASAASSAAGGSVLRSADRPARWTKPCMRCQPFTSASPLDAADARCRCRSRDRRDASARDRIRRAAPRSRRPWLPTAIVRAVKPALGERAEHRRRARRNGCP